jgi:membrane associated rhomboid family serine protease
VSDRYRHKQYRFQSPGGFGPALTPMVQRLLIANVAVFLLQILTQRSLPLVGWFALTPGLVYEAGFIWQPFTYMWLHGGPMHLLFNMFALWMFGGTMESVWGSRRLLRFYLICGVGAGVIILLWNTFTAYAIPTLGASGAIYGLLLAFSLTFPDRTIMLLFPPVPMKAIWFIPFLFLMNLLFSGGQNISHIGHLGGVIVAAFLMRKEVRRYIGLSSLRHRWHRWRMRKRLRSVRRDEWERRRDDDQSRH